MDTTKINETKEVSTTKKAKLYEEIGVILANHLTDPDTGAFLDDTDVDFDEIGREVARFFGFID